MFEPWLGLLCFGVLCFWTARSTVTVPLSTQGFKWVQVNLMLGRATPRSTSIPCPGEQKYEAGDKRRPDKPLDSYADFTLRCEKRVLLIFLYIVIETSASCERRNEVCFADVQTELLKNQSCVRVA